MIDQKDVAVQLARYFMDIKAVKLNPSEPFTWSKGWKSPIYCDHRVVLSHPVIRAYVREKLALIIQSNFIDVDVVAGVATGAIAHGALAADKLRLPFVYVRSKAKDHGTSQQIEGRIEGGENVVVVEDLISTGGSSLEAAEALRSAGCNVVGMVAMFSYEFDIANKAFKDANIPLFTLTNYPTLLEVAKANNQIQESDLDLLNSWREDPANWTGK